MNRSKKLCILLGVLAAACAATFAVTRMEARNEQIKTSGEIILALSSEAVQSLSWTYNGESLSFHKEGAWLYDGDEDFPVSEEKINELLAPFQALGAAFTIENVEDYGQYGLDDPICTIELSTADQSCKIALGDYSKMDAQRYVSLGDGKVYLVKHDPLEAFSATLRSLIAHDEIPALDQATELIFSGAENYSITCEPENPNTNRDDDVYFTLRGGKSLPLDTDRVRDYLDAIRALDLTDYVSYHASEEELEHWGLDEPELTLAVNYTASGEDGTEQTNAFVLHISRSPEDKNASEDPEEVTAYARVGDSKIIYLLSSAEYQRIMAASYDDFRHLEVLPAAFEDIRQVNISLEKTSYTLTSEQDGKERIWYYQEEPLDTDRFRSALEALTAEEFTDETPSGKEEIRLDISLNREDASTIRVQLYRYDGTSCIAVVDGESVCFVARSAVAELMEAVYAIVLD